ncbi:hypothetical protein [Gilliamella sp. Pas-s25]|uniref:hypothetical protein n=1 Tax=Gilliamella sp. Pas-s25 TaxID=2687310 RepID=UPI00135DBD3E|nr:hypothetical protein [Gilliamella sp. Pas-s25]MWP61388.1 hypothetical protein [Gilliamella sp. Pas-s25]
MWKIIYFTTYLNNKPSLMDYSDELKIIDMMMNLPISWIIKNKEEFLYALNILSDSHTIGNGFLLQTEKDDLIFNHFCQWLTEVNNKTDISLLGYIDDFSPDALKLDEFRKNNKFE